MGTPEQGHGGAPAALAAHGDEWLLTPLNKGIMSPLRVRGRAGAPSRGGSPHLRVRDGRVHVPGRARRSPSPGVGARAPAAGYLPPAPALSAAAFIVPVLQEPN